MNKKNDKIVRLPKASREVDGILHRAKVRANQQGWNKVIIIGQGKEDGAWYHSEMLNDTALGILEKVKYRILTDEE